MIPIGSISPSSTASRIGCAARYAALRVLDTVCGRRAEAGYGIQRQETSGGVAELFLQNLTHTTDIPRHSRRNVVDHPSRNHLLLSTDEAYAPPRGAKS